MSRISFPSSAESSEVLDAFRAWSDAASRTRKTESGIQLLGAPASPTPPKPEARKFELLRAEITHTTTSLTPVPPPSRAPTFDLLSLAARGTRSLPRPELPSAILRRSDLVLDPLPVVYDEDDDWAETLRYRRSDEDAPAEEAQGQEAPERRSSVPPPPASRSFTLLPPSPRQRVKVPPPFRSIRGGAATRPEPYRETSESGIVAKVSPSEVAPLSDLPPLLRSTVRKAFTRPTSSVTTTRVVFGPPRLPTPLRVELTALPTTPVPPPLPTPRSTAPVLDALPKAKALPAGGPSPVASVSTIAPRAAALDVAPERGVRRPKAEPSRVTTLLQASKPPTPREATVVALAVAKAEKAEKARKAERLRPVVVQPPVVITPPPPVEPAPARACEVDRIERDPFRASAPPLRAPSAKAHLHFVLAVAFVFACVAALLWLGAPFWRHLLAGLL